MTKKCILDLCHIWMLRELRDCLKTTSLSSVKQNVINSNRYCALSWQWKIFHNGISYKFPCAESYSSIQRDHHSCWSCNPGADNDKNGIYANELNVLRKVKLQHFYPLCLKMIRIRWWYQWWWWCLEIKYPSLMMYWCNISVDSQNHHTISIQ